VLRHGDTSAQNCLFEEERLSGLVDWEIARPQGAPGFDILNAAVALLDHGVGLVNWSEDRAVTCFETAWKNSPFFDRARAAARESVEAAGATARDYERLEIAFFARRLASRLADPDYYATGPASAARMLEIACAL
jgi:aminoglycoside phosphotransferase (APT) family kinase protein